MSEVQSPKPPVAITLDWKDGLVFGGSTGSNQVTLDSDGHVGPSPMQAVAYGLAGCMAMDVVHILQKGRHDLRGLRVSLRGERAPAEPRRFVRFHLAFAVTGSVAAAAVERAIALSRDKYCSVWHSLDRGGIVLETTQEILSP